MPPADTTFSEATATINAPEPDEELAGGEGGQGGDDEGESGQQGGRGAQARGQHQQPANAPGSRGTARDKGGRAGAANGKPDRRDRRAGVQSLEEQITSRIFSQVEQRWTNFERAMEARLARASQLPQQGQGQGQQGQVGGTPQPKLADRIRTAEQLIRSETNKFQRHDPRTGAFDWTTLERANDELAKLRVMSQLEEMGLTPEAVRTLLRARQNPGDSRMDAQRMEATARYATFVQEFPWIDNNNELTQQVAAYRDFLVAKGAPRNYQTLQTAARYVEAENPQLGPRPGRGRPGPFAGIQHGGRGDQGRGGGKPRAMALPAGAVSNLSPAERARVEGALFERDDDE